jgi:hypothetical protein
VHGRQDRDGDEHRHVVDVRVIPKAKPAIGKTAEIAEPFLMTKRKMSHAQFRSQQQTGDEARRSLSHDELDALPDEPDMINDADDDAVAKVPPTAEKMRMTKDQHRPPKPATLDYMLDPYAPGSEAEPDIDLSLDPSSDPNYDFAAHGWKWSAADQAMIPPPNP